jgi:hypothetical protein
MNFETPKIVSGLMAAGQSFGKELPAVKLVAQLN